MLCLSRIWTQKINCPILKKIKSERQQETGSANDIVNETYTTEQKDGSGTDDIFGWANIAQADVMTPN